jgi:hypothetical protein
VVGSYKHGNKPSGYTKEGEILDKQSDCQDLKMAFTSQSVLVRNVDH